MSALDHIFSADGRIFPARTLYFRPKTVYFPPGPYILPRPNIFKDRIFYFSGSQSRTRADQMTDSDWIRIDSNRSFNFHDFIYSLKHGKEKYYYICSSKISKYSSLMDSSKSGVSVQFES